MDENYSRTRYRSVWVELTEFNWSVVRMERGFGGGGTVLDHKLLSLNSFNEQTAELEQFERRTVAKEQFERQTVGSEQFVRQTVWLNCQSGKLFGLSGLA